jgi:uncharacterized membrane protein
MEETATLDPQSRAQQAVHALATQERWAWAAYALHAGGLFLFWPVLLGLAVNYAKYGDGPQPGVDTHHRYMRRTCWITLAVGAGVLTVMGISLVALLMQLGLDIQSIETDTAVHIKGLSLEHLWVGVLIGVGMFCMLVTWLWALFRIIRGMVRLSQDQGIY